MKMLIFSDTHGRCGDMLAAVDKYDPAMAVHLGDNISDGALLSDVCPGLPVKQVCGNCDFPRAGVENELVFEFGGAKFFICHGHTYGVKGGTDRLLHRAEELGADAAFFGHTHTPFIENKNGIWIANPGTASGCRTGERSCLICEVESGMITLRGKLL